MKKILFTFLSALALFSSCSSDNDTFTENVSDSNNEPKYTVNFDIKSDGFEVDKTPLRSSVYYYQTKVLQIVVYKESGEVYSDTLFTTSSGTLLAFNNGDSYPFSVELPAGNYHFAMMYTPMLVRDDDHFQSLLFHPQNYYTDQYGGSRLGQVQGGDGTNTDNYYQTFSLSVPTTNQESIPVVLEPMWSTVNISINDPKTFNVPSNAVVMRINVVPSYDRYSLSTKLAVFEYPHDFWDQGAIEISSARNLDVLSVSYNISKTKEEDNALKLIIGFYEEPDSGYDEAFISEYIIDLNTQVENGLHYKISGKLGNIAQVGGGQMNLSFSPFNEDNVQSLPF